MKKILRKIWVIFMVAILLFNVCQPVSVAASKLNISEHVEKAVNIIRNIENVDLSIKFVLELFNVDEEQLFDLVVFDNGYAIITKNGYISEYSVGDSSENPYEALDYKNVVCIYAGPGGYFIKAKDENINIDEEIEKNGKVKNFNSIKNVSDTKTVSNYITDELENYDVMLLDLNTWVGIYENRMYRYREWINTEGICGSYATSAMLAYYQDYVDAAYVPSSIRKRMTSTEPKELIEMIAGYAADDGGGTTCNMLSSATYWFLKNNCNIEINVDYDVLANRTWFTKVYQYNKLDSNVIYNINNGRPCVIELSSGSDYGAHFVLAYQYYEQGDYGYLFKIVDNWGDYRATISNKWVRGWVKIDDV